MEHIAAVLLLIGCSGDFKDCKELPAPIPIYETFEECGGDLSPTLRQARDQAVRVMAQCVYVDPAMAEEDAELVWDVDSNGRLTASVEAVTAPDMMLTSSIR